MTRRISITLPDEVAALLDKQANASAYIAESIQLRHKRESVRDMLARHGYHITDDGISRMRQRRLEQQRRIDEAIAAGEL